LKVSESSKLREFTTVVISEFFLIFDWEVNYVDVISNFFAQLN
jgi:hypothetical protein